MKSFNKANRYGISDRETQDCQGPAPTNTRVYNLKYKSKTWTTPHGVVLSESAHYVIGDIFTLPPSYADACERFERVRLQKAAENFGKYVNPFTCGKKHKPRKRVYREVDVDDYNDIWVSNRLLKYRKRIRSFKYNSLFPQYNDTPMPGNPTLDMFVANTDYDYSTFERSFDPDDYRYEFDNTPEVFDPQFGFRDVDDTGWFTSFTKQLEDLARFAGVGNADELLQEVEGIMALVLTLMGCNDYISMSAAVFLYARKHFTASCTMQIMEYLKDLFQEPQMGDEEPSEEEKSAAAAGIVGSSDWKEMMRNVRDNWALVRGNKLFTHFSKLLGLVVTLGMCNASSVTFEVKEYKIWEPDMKIVHGNALDIADAALETVTFFVENISLCFEEKSLKPLLMNDRAAAELDEEYARIILWWDLVKNGNLERVAGISTHEFDARLESLCSKLRNLIGTKNTFEKKLIQDKFMRALKVKNDYVTFKISCGLRRAPFCMELCGDSSQGKSSVGEQLITALLTSAKLPTGKRYQATYNASDKFFSTWTTDKLVLLIDDMANDKSDHVERPPTRVIIDVANNTPFYANMADLDSKGKVFVEPILCVVTTNVKDLDARVYSNCPYSIQRRMHMVITVNAKSQWQIMDDEGRPQGLDSKKVREHYKRTGLDPTFDDLWDLTVEKAVKPENLSTSATYAPMVFRDKLMKSVPFGDVMQMAIEMFHDHLEDQNDIIRRMEKRQKMVINLCGHTHINTFGEEMVCKQIKGYCDLHDGLVVEKQYGEEIADSMQKAGDIVKNRISSDLFGLDNAIEGVCTYALMSSAKKFARHWDWVSAIPSPWMRNSYFRNFMYAANAPKLKNSYIRKTCLMWTSIFGSLGFLYAGSRKSSFCGPIMGSATTGLIAAGYSVQKCMIERVKRDFDRELVDRNTIKPAMKALRDKHVGRICAACAVVGGLYTIARVYKAFRAMRSQGSLEPKTQEEVDQRDAESNPWITPAIRDLPCELGTENTTSKQLQGLIEKNLVYGTVTVDDKSYMVNGLFLRSNLVVIPDHYFIQDTIDVTFRKKNPDAAGGKFAARLSITQSWIDKSSDMRFCYCASGGSFKDLTKYTTDEKLGQTEFKLQWRKKDGSMTTADGLCEPRLCDNGGAVFDGYKYESLTMNTFKGLCGATVSANRRPLLLGIHLGGKAGTPTGCCGRFTKTSVLKACDQLRLIDGVLLSGTAEKFEAQILGVNVLKDTPLHPKSPLNYMPKNSQVEYYGSCLGATTFHSSVRPTVISEHVLSVMGEPNIYGPPIQNPQWEGWQTCLANLSEPALPYEPELLILAIRDYKEDMIEVFKNDLWRGAKPLNDHENLNGIPGCKFMDAIKLNTSVGYPLTGPKRRFVTELEPEDGKPNNRVLDPVIMDEINRCLDCYKRGERAYTIAKACKKDEVLSKRKCRIFYGNSIALTWLVRKYFLPILRVMQMNPLVSECAVGVNSHGPEWQRLHQFIMTHGEDRLFGGDYGKYDQKLPSQLLFAAMRIMIDFASYCNYTELDLKVMEAMSGDIVFAIIAFNGDLIGLTEGTHISGNSLTVIINGICGSLNLRCYFYSEYPASDFETRMRFRAYVALITYGDDNMGSVCSRIERFTIKGASEFLARYGQVYTMPDKESALLDFLPPDDFEFLKRKSVYHPELDCWLGALIDKSCIKMLHCHLWDNTSPVSQEHAAALNVDTALREWFNHGKDVYEQRRSQLTEVARLGQISHMCRELDITYDDRCKLWVQKYCS